MEKILEFKNLGAAQVAKHWLELPEITRQYVERFKNLKGKELELDLRKKILNEYGREVGDLISDENFNIWEAYSFLKKYTGLLDAWFNNFEYERRMTTIRKVLGI